MKDFRSLLYEIAKEILQMLLILGSVGLLLSLLGFLFWKYAPIELQEAFNNASGYVGQ